MSSRNSQLDGLRQQIDSLDDRIHDLLIERSSMIEQIIAAKGRDAPKLRPGREAEIGRRLVARHRGQFPAASVVRIWREIINAFTCMQGPFSIALSGAAEDRELRALARDHFGGMPERMLVEDTEAALRVVIAGEVTLAVLPWGDRTLSWLGHLLAATDSGLQICFGLPFVRENAGVATAAVAVGRVESEPTDSDRSVFCIADASGAEAPAIEAALRELGCEPLTCTPAGGDSARLLGDAPGPFWIVEIAGRLDPEALGRLQSGLTARSMVATPIGTYAEPIILSSEEQADR